MIRSLAVIAALIFGIGCDAGSAPEGRPVRTDSAGVEIVTSTGDDRSLEWRMEEEFSIGGRDDGPAAFYRVLDGGVDVADDGRIFVLDVSNRRVAVFDSDGSPLRTMGQEGGGPGELQRPVALRLEADQTVAVFDIGKQALVRFAPDGSPMDQHEVDALRVGADWHPWAQGAFWTLRDGADGGGRLETLVHVSAQGDTVPLVQQRTSAARSVELTSCGIITAVAPLFEPSLNWAAAGEHLAVNSGTGYVVDLYRGTRHVRSVRRDVEPMDATDELALEQLGEGRIIESSAGTHVCDPREELEKRGYAGVVPVIADIALALDGTVWVERASVGEDAGRIDILGSEGAYLGSLAAGVPFPIDFLPDGRPLVVTVDEFDVERLRVMRLER